MSATHPRPYTRPCWIQLFLDAEDRWRFRFVNEPARPGHATPDIRATASDAYPSSQAASRVAWRLVRLSRYGTPILLTTAPDDAVHYLAGQPYRIEVYCDEADQWRWRVRYQDDILVVATHAHKSCDEVLADAQWLLDSRKDNTVITNLDHYQPAGAPYPRK